MANNSYGCKLSNVCFTIKIKKNLDDLNDFTTSFNNCLSVANLVHIMNVCDQKNTFDFEKFWCFNMLIVMENAFNFLKPTTIIFGFDVYSKEENIRDKYLDFFNEKNENNNLKENNSSIYDYSNLYKFPDLFLENNNAV